MYGFKVKLIVSRFNELIENGTVFNLVESREFENKLKIRLRDLGLSHYNSIYETDNIDFFLYSFKVYEKDYEKFDYEIYHLDEYLGSIEIVIDKNFIVLNLEWKENEI